MKAMKMSSNKNIKGEIPSELQSGIFGGLLVITLIFLILYLPVYMMNNPPVCIQETKVEEIISVAASKASIKISDGTIINQIIKKYDKQENKFKIYVKINEPVCLKYQSSLDYYLAYILLI